jgi:hypothetical protein
MCRPMMAGKAGEALGGPAIPLAVLRTESAVGAIGGQASAGWDGRCAVTGCEGGGRCDRAGAVAFAELKIESAVSTIGGRVRAGWDGRCAVTGCEVGGRCDRGPAVAFAEFGTESAVGTIGGRVLPMGRGGIRRRRHRDSAGRIER